MVITLQDVKDEVDSLFEQYNFLKQCNADDDKSKQDIADSKTHLLKLINQKQTLMFDVLKDRGIE